VGRLRVLAIVIAVVTASVTLRAESITIPSTNESHEMSTRCSVQIIRFLSMSSSGPSQLFSLQNTLLQASAAEAEAKRCHLHPPSTEDELRLFRSGPEAYKAHCDAQLQQASDSLAAARVALDAHKAAVHIVAREVLETCASEARRVASTIAASAGAPLEPFVFHVYFIHETFTAVMKYFAIDVFWSTSGVHFMAFIDRYAKEAMAVYQSILSGKPPRFDMLLPGTQAAYQQSNNENEEHLKNGFMRALSGLISMVRRTCISDAAAACFQFLGCVLAPAFVLTATSLLLVVMLPVLCTYFVWYEWILQFMIRGLLLHGGLLSPLLPLSAPPFQVVEVAVWLLGEFPLACAGYSLSVLVLVYVFWLLSTPWRCMLLALVPK